MPPVLRQARLAVRLARDWQGRATSMTVEGWVRRAALLAIPLIAAGLYLVRERRSGIDLLEATAGSPGEQRDPRPSGALAFEGETPRDSAPRGLASALAERGEAALGGRGERGAAQASGSREQEPPESSPSEAKRRPLPVATSAAELPLADSVAVGRSRPSRSKRAPGPVSPCGGVEVRLITDSKDPAWAFASLVPAPGERAVIRHVGERIGSFQVDAIEWDRVWLRGGAGRCAVGMHFGAREAEEGLPNGKRPRLATDTPVEKPWRVPGEIANAIDKLSETEFSVERAMVPAIFERAGELLSGLQIDPVRHGDVVIGLEIGEVQTDSILERLGVETGDVVLALDGQPVQNLESLARTLEEARSGERLVARLRRNGEAFDLRVVAR